MNGVNLLALVLAGIFEGETRDAGGGLFRDDLQALDHARHDFMLDPGIQALGVFPDDDEVHAGIAGRNVRQVVNGTKVGVELELLAQGHVDAGEASAHRRGHRSLQADPGAFDRFDQFLGNVFVVLGKGLGARLKNFPIELYPGRFKDANRRLGNFRPDAIARNECDFVSHVDLSSAAVPAAVVGATRPHCAESNAEGKMPSGQPAGGRRY